MLDHASPYGSTSAAANSSQQRLPEQVASAYGEALPMAEEEEPESADQPDDIDMPVDPQQHAETDAVKQRRDVSRMQFAAYLLQVREKVFNIIHHACRLGQDWMVDTYGTMELGRLMWRHNNQDIIRADLYQGVQNTVERGDTDSSTIGHHITVASSFMGGPPYMAQLFQDAMAIVRKLSKPDYFVTFTCNPNWPEITAQLLPGQTSSDRPDLVSRVYRQKLSA